MKTFWISFKAGPRPQDLPFTDCSEGYTISEAVKKLGLQMSDVAEWLEIIERTIALAAAQDHANRRAKKGGRKAWNKADYNAACKKFNAIFP